MCRMKIAQCNTKAHVMHTVSSNDYWRKQLIPSMERGDRASSPRSGDEDLLKRQRALVPLMSTCSVVNQIFPLTTPRHSETKL